MSENIERDYDIVVVGAGPAGVAAALAASRYSSSVLLIEAGPTLGGELISGLPIDGCMNARGERIVGGIAQELFDDVRELGGFVRPLFDWRLIWAVCIDPVYFNLAINRRVARTGVDLLLYSLVADVDVESGSVSGITVRNKAGLSRISGRIFIDCSGDADLATLAGGPVEKGGPEGQFQPLTLVFRLGNVNYADYLCFIRDNPDQFILGSSPVLADKTPAECALGIYESGYPFAGLSSRSSLLGNAIDSGRMYPCTAIYAYPTCPDRGELGINATRIANIDATDPDALSGALPVLSDQVAQCMEFARNELPGFQNALLNGLAPRIGIRETRRVIGEDTLTADQVVSGSKSENGIAKGGHHVDIHGAGKHQLRTPVKGGDSYDITYGCLVPQRLRNTLVAGRCLSSTREANGSVRVMGQCMATGEAAGIAAAIAVEQGLKDTRSVPVHALRARLQIEGAVLDGTN